MLLIHKVDRIVLILTLLSLSNCQIGNQVYNFGSKSIGLMVIVTIFLIVAGCGNAIIYYIAEKRSSVKIKIIKAAESSAHFVEDISENSKISNKNFIKNVIKTKRNYEIGVKVEICKEINSQINQWVIYESARLSRRLEELSDRIDELENVTSPELEHIKKEANEISREIEIFKRHLSDEESG